LWNSGNSEQRLPPFKLIERRDIKSTRVMKKLEDWRTAMNSYLLVLQLEMKSKLYSKLLMIWIQEVIERNVDTNT
jgi:hypothetical protein